MSKQVELSKDERGMITSVLEYMIDSEWDMAEMDDIRMAQQIQEKLR